MELKQPETEANRWAQHWIALGFSALEQMVISAPRRGKFCFGDSPTLADLCLVPQFSNARRFNCDLSPYPTLVQIDAHCATLPAFAKAAPESQPDAE